MRIVGFFLALGTLMACHPAETVKVNRVSPQGLHTLKGAMVDETGRTVILRGVNVRAAGLFDGHPSIGPFPPFGEPDCRFLAETLGRNFLRLPINWSGLEPNEGIFDDTYVAAMLAAIRGCHAHGVWVLVDVHQDSYSKYVGHDGAPLWAHDPPADAEGAVVPRPSASGIDTLVSQQFAAFFAEGSWIADSNIDMLGRLATLIKDEPGVAGLEIMNEPYVVGNTTRLDAYQARAAQAIRKSAPDLPVYFEPSGTRNIFDQATQAGPFPVKGGVYAPHLYTGLFQGNWTAGDADRIRRSARGVLTEAGVRGTPALIGEFGANPDATGLTWMDAVLPVFDELNLSWAFWVYEEWRRPGEVIGGNANGITSGLYDPVTTTVVGGGVSVGRGALRGVVADWLSRPFPMAVAGTLGGFSYDAATRRLDVTMTHGKGTHLISAPLRVYPKGVRATCDGAEAAVVPLEGRAEIECNGGLLSVLPSQE